MNKKSLAFKFTVFAVLAVVGPAAAIAISLILTGRKALTDSIYIQQSQTAQRIANRVSIHLDNVHSVLSIASKEPGLSAMRPARQEESLRRLLRWQPTFKEAILLNAFGMETAKLVSQDNKFVPGRLISRKSRPEFQDAMAEGLAVASEPFFGGDRMPYFFVSCPTYGRRGVLVVKVRLDSLWDVVKQIADHQGDTAYIIDSKGYLLAHPVPEKVLSHTNMDGLSLVKAFKSGRTGRSSFGVHENDVHENVVSVVEAVPNLDWGVVVETPESKAYAPIRTMEKAVIKWTAISMCIILALALWRVRQIVKPVELLEEGARKIAHGHLDLDLDIHTGDELEHLAGSFKQMAGSLKQLEDLRRDLISMIVHDLKSPLSAIMSSIDYIEQNEHDKISDTSKRILSLSRKSSDELLQMIQNMLDVAKMEEGKLSPRLEKINPAQMMEECAENFRLQIEKESKQLIKNIDEGVHKIAVDGPMIKRVITNLLSNAIRHTRPKGLITVECRSVENFVELVVMDNGEGISPEYKEKIFDKFVQAERKRVRVRSGTGLGLTFCKMAVELHGGQIRVESEPGKGSTFIVRLPSRSGKRQETEKNLAETAA